MNSTPPRNALHLGISGFPSGSAAINKCLAVYRSLKPFGVSFLIINNRPFHAEGSPIKVEKQGKIEGFDYYYTPPSPYKKPSFLGRRWNNFMGRVNEFFLLLRLCRANKVDVAFYYPTNGSFLELLYYRVFSKIFGFALIAHYVEYRTAFKHSNPWEAVSDKLFDTYFFKYVDAVLPISEFLIEHLKSRGCTKPMLKIPPLADFPLFAKSEIQRQPYFFYVGSAAYMPVVQFILDSFDCAGTPYELHLLVNGNASEKAEFNARVAKSAKANCIKTFSNLSFEALVQKYNEASALLIPLSGTVTDTARFPQKIAEYLASGNAVITTAFGEVPHYLKDGYDAVIAGGYTVQHFAEKMEWVAANQSAAAAIGKQGRATGLKYFDINSYGEPLWALMLQLGNESK